MLIFSVEKKRQVRGDIHKSSASYRDTQQQFNIFNEAPSLVEPPHALQPCPSKNLGTGCNEVLASQKCDRRSILNQWSIDRINRYPLPISLLHSLPARIHDSSVVWGAR